MIRRPPRSTILPYKTLFRTRLCRTSAHVQVGQGDAGVQSRALLAIARRAARVRRPQRLDLPRLRRGRAAPHGVSARPGQLCRRAHGADPAGVPRDLSEVLSARPGRRQGNVRLRELLEESFRAAVAAADPLRILGPHLPQPPRGRTFVAAAGKAAAAMALAVESRWNSASPLDGIAITRYGHGVPTGRIRLVEGGHRVRDSAGEGAAREILEKAGERKEDGLLPALFSGGGSSLLSLPAEGISMADLKDVTAQLLRSGATIQEINAVRKHLSAIAGGRLAAASRARTLALIISDVTGDHPTHIASGP